MVMGKEVGSVYGDGFSVAGRGGEGSTVVIADTVFRYEEVIDEADEYKVWAARGRVLVDNEVEEEGVVEVVMKLDGAGLVVEL